MVDKSFQEVAQRIFTRCNELYWHVPNNVKQAQIHVKSWHVPPSTAQFLYEKVKEQHATQILELGTSAGYSTIWLAQAVKENGGGQVDTIEYFEPKQEVALQHFKEAGLDEFITLHKGMILEVLKEFDQPLDFIFMDADRGHYDQYFPYLYKLLKKGGMIVVDNAGNYRDRMVRFLKLAQESEHESDEFVAIDNGLFIYVK